MKISFMLLLENYQAMLWFYQGTLRGAWISPVEVKSGQAPKERLAYKLVDLLAVLRQSYQGARF